MKKRNYPTSFLHLRDRRFERYIFFYNKPNTRYYKLFACAVSAAFAVPVVYYVRTNIRPEFSCN